MLGFLRDRLTDRGTGQEADGPRKVLNDVFGHKEFRGRQEEIVHHIVAGGSGLVLMPTGGGKSLCYQVPALCRPGLGVVVSPLIALMEDQVSALRQAGVAAAALHSEMEEGERGNLFRDLSRGALKLLYVSPERLNLESTLERLGRTELALFAIDEAHCVSQWGHHFRPDYRGLDVLARLFPEVPRIALTATADARTVEDIRERLSLTEDPVFRGGFDRPNIRIEAAPRESARRQILAFAREASDGRGAGIVYCATRKGAEQTAGWLRENGHDAISFHAGMEAADKRAAHKRFASGDAVVMAATVAFGMGIDRPDVRWVAHAALPASPESWYQEIGRAGRDGLPARALLLHGAEDIVWARHRLEDSPASDEQKRIERERLNRMVAIAESPTCRRRILLRCFGEDLERDCGNCDACLRPPSLRDGTVAAQKLLSAVVRTGSRFGLGHLVDVLRGEKTEKVLQFGHDQLPTFGVGRDVSPQHWRSIARQLVARGALDVAVENHGEYRPTEAARPILKGQEKVMLREEAALPRISARGGPRRREAPAASGDPVFEALRAWRRDEAQRQALPAYMIFSDRTLSEIAAQKPTDLDELATVPGVGASKLERYGEDVLDVLATCGRG
jgi:ATP-dependent DNA helicase RecQ